MNHYEITYKLKKENCTTTMYSQSNDSIHEIIQAMYKALVLRNDLLDFRVRLVNTDNRIIGSP